jgi:glycosyltransferase involved in cell wall biosynthesis
MDRVPRVSIGLPVYNGQAFLREAVESILAQTYDDFELIICDNASTDATQAICAEFAAADRRVRYHRNDANLGAAPNFNRTFELSRGRYFKWAAADDRIAPDYLRRCVDVLDSDPSAVLCHSRPGIIDRHGALLRFEGPEGVATLDDGTRVEHGGAVDPVRPLDSSDVARRVRAVLIDTKWCFDMFGLMRSDVIRHTPLNLGFYGSDKVLLLSLAMRGRFVELPEPLFLRRFHPGQSSNKDARQLATWMDARTKLTGPVMPAQAKCLSSYLKEVVRADLKPCDRARCLAMIVVWCGWLARKIYRERKSHGFLHRHLYNWLRREERVAAGDAAAAAEPASSAPAKETAPAMPVDDGAPRHAATAPASAWATVTSSPHGRSEIGVAAGAETASRV